MLTRRCVAASYDEVLHRQQCSERCELVTALVLISQTLAKFARPHRLAAIAVFALGALSSVEAHATCGDWLAPSGSSSNTMAGSDHSSTPNPPCDGPSCRRSRHDLPVVPPGPSRQLERPERWFWLSEALAAEPALSSLLPPEAALKTPEGFRPSIERPPRL